MRAGVHVRERVRVHVTVTVQTACPHQLNDENRLERDQEYTYKRPTMAPAMIEGTKRPLGTAIP